MVIDLPDGFNFDIEASDLPENTQYKRHIGIYGYKAALLNIFVT